MTIRVSIAAAAVVVVLSGCQATSPTASTGPTSTAPTTAPGATAPAGRFEIVTEPDDGMARLYALLSSATTSVDMEMYELQDIQAEDILSADAARDVTVRVILDRNRESEANAAAYAYLMSHGVQVHWAPPGFEADHEKAVVVDGTTAAILTLNLTSRYYATTRDFGVIDRDQPDVRAIEQVFDADFAGETITAPTGDDLVWSPGSQAQLAALIDSAQFSVAVENEEMSDPTIIAALSAAARRHVQVTVTMTASSEWDKAFATLTGAGVQVRVDTGETPLYIHAKVADIDSGMPGAMVFIGSENDTAASLERNRELGVILADPALTASVGATVQHDFEAAAPWHA